MDEDDALKPTPTVVDNEARGRAPYHLLMRQSKKLGGVATRTYDVTKEFLKRDVPLPPAINPDTLLFGREHISTSHTKEKDDLRSVVKRSHEVLARVRAVILPMNLFPDDITVDRTKITITKRSFFWSADVLSIRVEDILNVECSIGPFFGSLDISSRIMNSTDHFSVNYLWRKDALYLKQLIQGYYIAQHNKIDTKDLTRSELIDSLLELGSDSSS